MKQAAGIAFALSALLWLGGCAPPFSRQALDQVDRSISFRELQKAPGQNKGKWVMLGGVIVSARNTAEGTVIEVLQKPLDRQGRPRDTDATEGRFIVTSGTFLDSAVYHTGRAITVIGEAAGEKVQPLGEIQYHYPVVTAEELHLWEPGSGPRVHFSVGVGVFHSY